MTPEAARFLEKARTLLEEADICSMWGLMMQPAETPISRDFMRLRLLFSNATARFSKRIRACKWNSCV